MRILRFACFLTTRPFNLAFPFVPDYDPGAMPLFRFVTFIPPHIAFL